MQMIWCELKELFMWPHEIKHLGSCLASSLTHAVRGIDLKASALVRTESRTLSKRETKSNK